mgnify:CR=1 FL=1
MSDRFINHHCYTSQWWLRKYRSRTHVHTRINCHILHHKSCWPLSITYHIEFCLNVSSKRIAGDGVMMIDRVLEVRRNSHKYGESSWKRAILIELYRSREWGRDLIRIAHFTTNMWNISKEKTINQQKSIWIRQSTWYNTSLSQYICIQRNPDSCSLESIPQSKGWRSLFHFSYHS